MESAAARLKVPPDRLAAFAEVYAAQGELARNYEALLQKVRSTFCLLYTSPSPRDGLLSRMPSSA